MSLEVDEAEHSIEMELPCEFHPRHFHDEQLTDLDDNFARYSESLRGRKHQNSSCSCRCHQSIERNCLWQPLRALPGRFPNALRHFIRLLSLVRFNTIKRRKPDQAGSGALASATLTTSQMMPPTLLHLLAQAPRLPVKLSTKASKRSINAAWMH